MCEDLLAPSLQHKLTLSLTLCPPLPCTHVCTHSDELEALDSWDPRRFDYESSTFNSYLSGPGALLPNPSGGSGPKPVSVFIDNIPDSCSKVRQENEEQCTIVHLL